MHKVLHHIHPVTPLLHGKAPHRILYTMPVDTARYAVDSVRGLLHDMQGRCSTEDAQVVSIIGAPSRHLQLLCVREALVSERERVCNLIYCSVMLDLVRQCKQEIQKLSKATLFIM
jgi:hypothetical protein